MRLFLDTANIDEIREINRWGVLSGVTTNPSLVAKENDDPERVWKEILSEVEGDISLETTELETDAMVEQGIGLAQMAPNAVVNPIARGQEDHRQLRPFANPAAELEPVSAGEHHVEDDEVGRPLLE